MNDKIERFKTMFLDECGEHVRTLERTLTAMRSGARSQELVDDAFRAIHSVKGGAGMFAFDRVVPFAHIFETALERVRVGQIEVSDEFTTVALRATDCLSDLILAVGSNTDLAPGYESNAQAALTKLVGLTPQDFPQLQSASKENRQAAPSLAERFEIGFHPHAHLFKRASEPLFIVRQLQGLGTLKVTTDQSKLPSFSDLQPLDAYLGWHFELETDRGETAIREVFQFVEGDCDLTIQVQPSEISTVFSFDELITAAPADHKPSQNELAGSTIRVEVSRIDRLVNLAGEIAISEALVAQQIDQSLSNVNPRLFQELSQLLIHTQNLQDSVMAIRAQPISTIFDRMPRLVRELSDQTSKKIILRTAGENTEIDKTVIEQLSDPIMHMIRNAADHGIESTEDRAAAGKPADGLIHLRAEQRGSRIVIEISDDGRGIDREKVRQKAIAKNLIPADAILSNEDIDNLIFLPGFSTAEKVTNLSGRGVGMDVVKRNIQKLGGRVSLRSEQGRGSTVILTLPLTLAVLEGMIVRSGVESYVIPISNIIECRASWQSDAGAVPGFGEVLNVRGGYVGLVHLSSVFNSTTTSGKEHSVAIIAEVEGGAQIALVVDEIIGQQQVVIKNITDNLDPVPGIAGATILGDGRVALILDATEIAKLSASNSKKNNLSDIQHRRQVA